MSKKSKGLIIISIALIFVLMGYLVYSIIGVERVENGQSYEYKLLITPKDVENYTLYVPIAINEDGSVSELMDDLHITKGNASYEIIETEYGKVLKIVANGEVNFESSGKRRIPMPHLSMLNVTEEGEQASGDVEFWVYCDKPIDSDNITLTLHLSAEVWRDWYNGLGMHKWYSYTEREEQIEDVAITQGWQKVHGYILMELGN